MTDNPFTKPLADLQSEYEERKQELRQCIDAWYALPERFPWQRRNKEDQRRYCCQILEALRKLAPEAQEVRDREAELGGCSSTSAGGRS